MIAPMLVEVGKPVVLSGYAEDYGKQIVSVQFSLDNGEHWTDYDVSDSTSELWVYWTFSYTPEQPGSYRLLVRSVNSEGAVSPLADVAE
ncbi:MAG: molybdopterin-binding protein, partial [Raoultibacter sp.]